MSIQARNRRLAQSHHQPHAGTHSGYSSGLQKFSAFRHGPSSQDISGFSGARHWGQMQWWQGESEYVKGLAGPPNKPGWKWVKGREGPRPSVYCSLGMPPRLTWFRPAVAHRVSEFQHRGHACRVSSGQGLVSVWGPLLEGKRPAPALLRSAW